MSSKSDKERQKQIQDKCLAILGQLLRDEDNKYCVDCDAKGPRWASWNLGIFLCIRCAGIHRNLGVHISKVKSVNLDTWTPEQIAYLQEMGNSRARAVYEANLPDNFRRPQTDSSLEAFIRAKYETKKYIAKEWVPPQISKIVFQFDDEKKRPKEKKPSKSSMPPVSAKKTEPENVDLNKVTSRPKSSGTADLLELSEATVVKPPIDDLFGGFISAETSQVLGSTTNSSNAASVEIADLKDDLDQANMFAQLTEGARKQPLSNESILSLYNQGGGGGGGGVQVPQMMGLPLGNVYMGQPAQAPFGAGAPGLPPLYGGHNGVPPGSNCVMGGTPNVPLTSGTLGTNPFLGPGLCPSYGSWYPPTNYSPRQMQMQMASLNLGQQPQYPGMVSHQAPPNPNVSWNGQQSGHTLSVNLWK